MHLKKPILLGFLTAGLLCVVPLWAQGTDQTDHVVAYGDRVVRFSRSGGSVVELTGNVVVTRGDNRLHARRAVLLVDEGRSAREGVVVMECYAEGQVVTHEKGALVESPRVYFTWRVGRLTVDDEDGQVEAVSGPTDVGLLERADQVRGGEVPPTVPGETPPAPPSKEYARATELQPMRFGTIYSQQEPAHQLDIRREGDFLVTIATGHPDIVFLDPDPRMGQLELLADNLVVWVNQKALEETGDVRQAGLQIYAEGHVRLYHQERKVSCERLFYDYGKQQALLVGGVDGDAVIEGYKERGQGSELRRIPFYYRAREIRQLSRMRFEADDVKITTCAFGRPHWAIKSRRMDLTLGVDESATADGPTPVKEEATFYDNFFTVHDIPLAYLPEYRHSLKRDRAALRRLEVGNSTEMGTEVRTAWDLYSFECLENDWSDLSLLADVYTKRGVGLGLEFDYNRQDAYGKFFGYYIHDKGEDTNGPVFDNENRGRVHWLHRQFLTERLRADFEFSYQSDSNFLNEYFEQEAKEWKEEENIAFLHYVRDNMGLTLLGKFRVNDFLTEVERLPEARGLWIGQPLLGDRLVYTTDSRVGQLRRRQSEDLLGPPGSYDSFRFDTEHELQMPLFVGPVKVSPFVGVEYTYYSADVTDQSADRLLASAGVRTAGDWWRLYDVASRLWDLNGLRHIITPSVTYQNVFHSSQSAGDLLQFDEIDARDRSQVVTLDLRQRLQTKRPLRGRTPGRPQDWRLVDWMVLEAMIDFFPDADRDNAGRDFSNLEMRYRWEVTDLVTVLADGEFDLDERHDVEALGFGFNINRSARFSLFLGQRYIRQDDSNVFIGNMEYRVDDRYRVGMLGTVNFQTGEAETLRLTLIRNLHQWEVHIGVEQDMSRDDTRFLLQFVPAGFPQVPLRLF